MRTTALEHHYEPTEIEIQKAAYFLWLELGCPNGRDQETWFTAKETLRHRRIPGSPGQLFAPPPANRRALRTEISNSHSQS